MTWETMTVRQMGQLLRMKDKEEMKSFWQMFSKSLAKKPDDKRRDSRTLNDLPTAPAGYFLAHIAAICTRTEEKEQFEAGALESMRLVDEKYLHHTLEEYRGIAGWMFALSHFMSFKEPKNPGREASNCWEHIWRRVKDESSVFTQELSLKELLAKIQEANKEANKEENEKTDKYELRISVESIKYLTGHLNKQSAKIVELWQKFGEPSPNELCDLLNNGIKQIILTGAPGTGKTYMAGEAAKSLGTPLTEGKPYYRVQFHPSYDYTDFVEGLRPIEDEDGKLSFVKMDGQFKAFCRQVVRNNRKNYPKARGVDDPDRKYFFLIDEINRADLSKVFGELMFCLESDKRGEPVQTQYQNLPTYGLDGEDVFANGFFIPKNVYMIGTMNDIDRSVESMDFALRRRFVFREVKVEDDLLTEAFQSGNFGALLKENAEYIAKRIMELNKIIRDNGKAFGLNEQYDISQGQFASLPEKETLQELLNFVWEYRIESLLREYVRGEDINDVDKFIKTCEKAFKEESTS